MQQNDEPKVMKNLRTFDQFVKESIDEGGKANALRYFKAKEKAKSQKAARKYDKKRREDEESPEDLELRIAGKMQKEELNESMDLMSSLEEMVKKSGNTILDSQLNFQKFDKEIFFDFEANGIQYRVHKDKEDFVSITNMDSNESGRIETTDDLIPYIN